MALAFGLLRPAAARSDAPRLAARAGGAAALLRGVIAASLLLFDVVLQAAPDPAHPAATWSRRSRYFIIAAIVLTRSDVDVTRVFTASVLTTAVIGLALQDTLGNIMAGLALQLERDFEVGDWINLAIAVADRRPHPRGALARDHDRHQERRPDADSQLGDHARDDHELQPPDHARTGSGSPCASTSATRRRRCAT